MANILNEQTMFRLLAGRAYPRPGQGDVLIFGLRSYSPADLGGSEVQESVEVIQSQLDYRTVRCTLGLWKVGTGIAVFPGSTVPKGSSVAAHSLDPWGKVNQMVPGCYRSYKLGTHGGLPAHRALRQVREVVIRRSDDGDSAFELTDPIYVDSVGYSEGGTSFASGGLVSDNIHCGRYYDGDNLIPETRYSSVGCQVVAGHTDGSAASEAGPWRKFIRRLYNDDDFRQDNYTYLLFSKEEVESALSDSWSSRRLELAYGSYHEEAKRIQKALREAGFYTGDIDGDFRRRSVTSLIAFERSMNPDGGASGRTTPVVCDQLGIQFPEVGEVRLVTFGSIASDHSPVVPDSPLASPVASSDLQPPMNAAVVFDDENEIGNLLEDSNLVPRIDVAHEPLSEWRISGSGNPVRYHLTHVDTSNPIYLGYDFRYTAGSPDTRGLARTSGARPKLTFEPSEWEREFGFWPELIYPTSWAESNANFLVANAWDKAAMTLGFIQLAAHTGDDLIPLMRRMVSELPEESAQWFPELKVIGGRLCYVRANRFKSLEEASPPGDGGPKSSWYRGDFMTLLNPSRFLVDLEEVHVIARWCEWSRRSPQMRRIQVEQSIQNMKDSLIHLHRALLKNGASKYPKGVDGMRCDHLAAALAVPHLSPSKVNKAVQALLASDVLRAFEKLEYGPGDREKAVVDGVRKRGERLSKLRFDLTLETPVAT